MSNNVVLAPTTGGALGAAGAYNGGAAVYINQSVPAGSNWLSGILGSSSGGSTTGSSATSVASANQNAPFAYSNFNYQSGSNAGGFSLNLPTDVLTGAGGGDGLNFSFNFGSNPDTIAQNAYGFVQNQNQNAEGFLGQTISNTQNWLGTQTSGALSSIVSAFQNFFPSTLSAFNQVSQNENQFAQGALSAQTYDYQLGIQNQDTLASLGIPVLNNAINSSLAAAQAASQAATQSAQASAQAASNSGGGCYITTAVCEYAGEKDDCETLETLRAWRDRFVASGQVGRDCIELYYREAPHIVHELQQLPAVRRAVVFARLRRIVRRSASAIRRGYDGDALIYYVRGIALAKEYANV